MKRALLATLWIGAVAAAFAVALQVSGLLAPLASWVARMGLPSGGVGFANFLLVIVLSFAVAWTLLQVPTVLRRVGLVAFLVADLLGATWLSGSVGSSFPPLPAIAAAVIAALLVFVFDATRSSRQRRETARLFVGRLAQPGLDRLTESAGLDLSEPATREASFVFCEIANQAELIDELPAAICAQLASEFTEFARTLFCRLAVICTGRMAMGYACSLAFRTRASNMRSRRRAPRSLSGIAFAPPRRRNRIR